MKDITGKGRKRIFDTTNGKCFYCGCELNFNNYHADHFKAKSVGGKASGNLVPSCPDCNLFKGNLSLEEFREKISKVMCRKIDGRIISKYYEVKVKPVKFYFEECGYGYF